MFIYPAINPLNAKLNPICHLLVLLRAHPILHISRIRVKHYKELWRVEDRAHSGRLKRMRAEAALKMVREWTCQNLLWK